MRKILLLTAVFFLALGSLFAQSRKISGKVTSTEDGTPLPGVNVIIKGTTTGTATDANGAYSLEVSGSDAIITFSFIGLTSQEVAVGDRSVIDVSLALDVTQLTEVVVTGYGVATKRDLTGAVSSVKGAAIQNLPVQSFDKAIQGRMAGVQVQSTSGAPGGAVNIRVRGPGSLSNNTPLYIVDGVQVQSGGATFGGSSNALAQINPNDIESIDVLKDAAAAAIYGAQSANGVVVITTKRGKKGASTFDATFQQGYTQPLNLYDVMNAQQFATIREAAYINAGLNPAAAGSAHAQYGNPNDPSTIQNMDWVDAMFRTGKMTSANLTAQGGDSKTSFYISGSVEKQEGQVIRSEWTRQTLRTNFEHRATDRFTMLLNLGLTRQTNLGAIADGNFVNGPFQSSFVSQPGSPAKDENGNYNPYPAHLPLTGAGHNFNYNILQGVNQETRYGVTAQALTNMNLQFKITDWLTAIASGGLDFADTEYFNKRPSTIPIFAGFGGQVTEINQRLLNYNVFGTLNFAKKFADVHNVSAIVGWEYKDNSQRQQTAVGRGFAYPQLVTLNNAANNFDVAGFNTGYKRVGGFVRANYDFKNKYLVNFTFRRDGNSRFGLADQFGNFWAVGAAWRITDESFMSGLTFLSNLKLRASYGVTGNAEGIGNFQSRTNYGSGGQYLGGSGTRQNLGNDLLNWEQATQSQVGLDFGFLGDRIYGTIDFYREDTEQQLLNTPLPQDSGYGSVIGNTGNVRNQGVEIELGATVLDVAGFKYSSTFNITINKNEVISLGEGVKAIGTSLFVGEPIGFIYGAPYAGVNPANGKPMWYDINNTPVYSTSTADGRILGYTLPKYYGGWTNSFSYKGINLEVFFQYQLGNDAFLGDFWNIAASGSFRDNQLVDQLDYWKQPGDVTNVPMPYEGGTVDGFDQQDPSGGNYTTGRYMADGGYIRLKQITLSYDLPSSITSKVKMRRINVFVQAMNLATFSKFPGIDPEVIGAVNDGGISSFGNYPNGKQLTAGITLGF